VVSQIAVSLVLLVGALLFVRSFYNLATFDAGIRQEGIGVLFVNFERLAQPDARWKPFGAELLEQIKRVPGVENAAQTTQVPLLGGTWAEGVKAGVGDQSTAFGWVSPEYFATLDVPLLAGRRFDARDTSTSAPVAIVNETFGRVFFPGQPLLGKTLMSYAEPGYPETHYEIVGVVPDAKVRSLREEPMPAVLVPSPQFPAPRPLAAYFVRSANPDATLETIRRSLVQGHADLRINSFVLQRRVRDGLVQERLMAMLSGFFGVVAALLAAIGLYGVMAYVMQRRRNEVGIRLALGAQPGEVVRMVLRDAGVLVAGGVALGCGLSVVAGRSAQALLFELESTDVATYAGSIALLVVIALVASAVPARRASRVDPMLALRQD
jgi:predicted permease